MALNGHLRSLGIRRWVGVMPLQETEMPLQETEMRLQETEMRLQETAELVRPGVRPVAPTGA